MGELGIERKEPSDEEEAMLEAAVDRQPPPGETVTERLLLGRRDPSGLVACAAGRGRLIGLVAIVGTLFLIGLACGEWGGGSDPAKETPAVGVTEVRLDGFDFAPANIVIDAGTTVTWTNYDGASHTVTSDEGDELDSELLSKTETFSHTFDTPGEYYYHCKPHSNMHGLITVLPRP